MPIKLKDLFIICESVEKIIQWCFSLGLILDLSGEKILEIDSEKIGGENVIVEIDESKFGKRKYHKGRRVEGQWVFGGIERDSKKSFFASVENRTKETLLKLIKDNIKPGTTIISDCWKAYDCLGSEGFEHLKVNHSVNFVDPETGAHTNTIESTWRALKKSLPKYGTVKSLYDTYFSQYCVRKKYIIGSEDPFLAFINLIKKVYNPEKQKQALITTETITVSVPQPASKKPRVLNEITNTLNSSLDDFQA
ncbi:Hypothetical predicted protein [Mytilus galloprovincialis]|uniref:ISXO2-like transposase domain-containing protein n=1 Tax=Mytilus galloprovincialis TaxID=29158 RepID=A0A8B6CF00_MYTGA|nr:Hypothetical predicted protein [Mytilus galloprovincialis]